MKKAFVLMGNDYPDAVFLSEEKAHKALDEKKKNESSIGNFRVYWRLYEFEVQE